MGLKKSGLHISSSSILSINKFCQALQLIVIKHECLHTSLVYYNNNSKKIINLIHFDLFLHTFDLI